MKTKMKKRIITLDFMRQAEEDYGIEIIGDDPIRQAYCDWWNNDMVFLPSPEVQQFITINEDIINNYKEKQVITAKIIIIEYLKQLELNYGHMDITNTLIGLGKKYGMDLNYIMQFKQAIGRSAFNHLKEMDAILPVGSLQFVNSCREEALEMVRERVFQKTHAEWYELYRLRTQEYSTDQTLSAKEWEHFYFWYVNDYLRDTKLGVDALLEGYVYLTRNTVFQFFDIMREFPRKAQGDMLMIHFDFTRFGARFEEIEFEEAMARRAKHQQNKQVRRR